MSWISESLISTLLLSLKVSVLVVIFVLPLAVFLGYRLARMQNTCARLLTESLISLPLALPPVALGYLLLLLLGTTGPVGAFLQNTFGVRISFSLFGVVIAAVVVSLPLAVRNIRVSMESIDPHLEEAALTLGATPWQTFSAITFPLAWPGILSGAAMAFIRSLGEFGATMILAGNIEGETRTLSVAMWTYLQEPEGESDAFRLLIFSIVFGFFCLLISELSARKLRYFHAN